jgi:HK97 family phage major capsid protein
MKHASELEFKEGDPADDQAALVTKALDDFRTALDDRQAKFKDRLDQLEAKMNRPGRGAPVNDQAELERKSLDVFLRGGADRMEDLERKTLSLSGNTALTPPEFGREVIKLLRLFSPIRNYAKVVTIGASEVQYPRRTGSTSASWVADTANRSESEPSYEGITITPYELATYVDVSNQLLEDNAYDLAGEIASDLAESFGIAEGSAFVSGDGNGKPAGLLTATGIPSMVTGAAADFPTSNPADVLIKVFHSLPAAYAQNGTWIMNRNTLGNIRQFKDGMGRYLVLDGISEGAPVTLLGRPVVEAVDMPNIAANATPIMFGDLSGYRIIDRISFQLLRDPYSQATSGQTRFHARRRVGASLTHPDRLIKLKVAAS